MDPTDAVEIRPVVSGGEIATWADTYNRSSPCRPEGARDLRHRWAVAPEWQALIAWRGRRPVGVAHVELEHWSPESRHAEAAVSVCPEDRRQGIGTALYAAVSTWSLARGRAGLDVWIDDAEADAPRFWSRRGFVEVSRERRALLDLTAAPPVEPVTPGGVRLETLESRPDLEPGMYRVAVEGAADVPGADPFDSGDFEHWRSGELRLPGLLEGCTVVALAGDEVIGFATLVRLGGRPTVAEHEMTAVARAWRGRGVATAMKARQIALARAAGLHALEATNEARNAPMLAINDRLGYRPAGWDVELRGPLASQGPAPGAPTGSRTMPSPPSRRGSPPRPRS